MSAKVDLVRTILARWERGDYGSSEWAHPQIEYVYADGPEPGRWLGRAEIAEAWRVRMVAWEGIRIVAEEYREIDDERVLVLARVTGRGKASGVSLEHVQPEGAILFTVREGKVTKLVAHWNRDRALADLGLAPGGNASERSR